MPIDPPEGYATSATEAVILLRNAYLTLDLTRLDKVLHDDFAFELSEGPSGGVLVSSRGETSSNVARSHTPSHDESSQPSL